MSFASGPYCVLRGGWYYPPLLAQIADSNYFAPDRYGSVIGLRLVRRYM